MIAWILAAVLVWILVGLPVAVVLGRSIRLADDRSAPAPRRHLALVGATR